MTKSTKPKRKTKSKQPAPSFEECLSNLQQIVQQLEQGELGLAESLQSYEDGVQQLKQCYRQLASAEQRVELLSEIAEDGSIETEPFSEEAMTLEEKAAARGARRTRKSRPAKRRSPKPAETESVDDSPGLF